MTLKEISEIKESKIINVFDYVGSFGKSVRFQITKETSRFTQETFYYIVTRAGVLKYMGNALYAIYEGKENVDFKKFKTATEVYNFINH